MACLPVGMACLPVGMALVTMAPPSAFTVIERCWSMDLPACR